MTTRDPARFWNNDHTQHVYVATEHTDGSIIVATDTTDEDVVLGLDVAERLARDLVARIRFA
ncbi:hypothetical protein C8K30_1011071 [Promicromonospora sp. AC04]|nr:hypothetical protein C8K30_1011071 [Promicromonospora sp. AC04]